MGSLPKNGQPIQLNGAIHVTCTILKLVAVSTVEAEQGALFHNAQQAKIIRLASQEMGHPQPATPIHIDDTIAVGIVNSTIKCQHSKSMEMRYFWLLYCAVKEMFTFIYTAGQENLTDYPTKHHMADIHQHIRPYYLQQANSPVQLKRASWPSAQREFVETLEDGYHKKILLPHIPAINQKQAHSARVQLYRTMLTSPRHTHIPCGTTPTAPITKSLTLTSLPHGHGTAIPLHDISQKIRHLTLQITRLAQTIL